MDNGELKPCPFCGGKARAIWNPAGDKGRGTAFVECSGCGAAPYLTLVGVHGSIDGALETAEDLWNRRKT